MPLRNGPALLPLLLATVVPAAGSTTPASEPDAPGSAAVETEALPAALRLTESIDHYVVEARNLSDFVAVMQKRKAEGDGDWPGRTTATLQVRYRLLPVEDGCRVEQLGVALDVVIRLPHWEPADAARASIREQWERMKIGIETHERGHRDIAVDAAAKLAERLAAFVPTPGLDCAAVDRRILRERLKAQMAHQGRDQAYDRRTRHGLTQVPEGPGQTERRRELPTSPASVAPRNRL